MKTKKIATLILLIAGTLIIKSCKFLEGKGSLTTDSNVLCLDYKNSEKSKLNTKLVNEMTELYQNNPQVGTDHVKAIRFDLETLKKFIYHIELEAKKQNKRSQDLGIRIYYARYPKLASWSDPNLFEKDLSGFLGNPTTEQYVGKHTLIMIPTINNNGVHQDYNPLATNSISSNINRTSRSSNKEGADINQQTFALMPQKSDNLRQNHGELYPPYSNNGMDFTH